jgi:catechol 2,3-dioxygenase-like lactoylglutathione lyase family enzyme
MPAFTITGTHHTSFTVSDLDRTLAFLRDGLGLQHTAPGARDLAHVARITGVPGAQVRIAFVRCPGHDLELIEYSQPADRSAVKPRPCDVGFAHLCFVVDDIQAAVARAADFDVRVAGAISGAADGPAPGARSVYLRDPDGITFELVQLPTAAGSRP